MSDLYSELLVKRERTIKDSITKYGLIVLTAIAVIAGLIITPLTVSYTHLTLPTILLV